MKYVRIFLGIFMLFFGLNRMFHFMPEPPWPEGAAAFLSALDMTGYMTQTISLADIFVGALLIANVLVPFALLIGMSVLGHSILFHMFLAPETALFAIVGSILNIVLIYHYRESYIPLLGKNLPQQRV